MGCQIFKMYLLWIYVFLNCCAIESAHSSSLLWTWRPIDELNMHDMSEAVTLDGLENSTCIYDSLRFGWNVRVSSLQQSYVLAVIHDDSPLAAIAVLLNGSSTSGLSLHCVLVESHCIVQTDNIIADIDRKRLVVHFKQDTNMPKLSTAFQISSVLQISPPILGAALGEWISPSRLEIVVEDKYFNDIMAAHKEGRGVSVAAKSTAITMDPVTEINIRPTDYGSMQVFVLAAESLSLVSKIHTVKVLACSSQFVPRMSKEHEYPHKPSQIAIPAISIQGTIAVSGKSGVVIPSKTTPSMKSGNWSLSFWIYLLEEPNGKFRSLFFKGNGASEGRTPSAWLLPGTRRLTLRSSTASDPDLGAESLWDIPVQRWVHLAFSFTNHTQALAQPADVNTQDVSKDNDEQHQDLVTDLPEGTVALHLSKQPPAVQGPQYKYAIRMFVNGREDISMSFNVPVLGNADDLSLFHDISHLGPVAFARDIIVWNAPLSKEDVIALHGAGAGDTASTDIALSVLRRTSHRQDNFTRTQSTASSAALYHSLAGEDSYSHCDTDYTSSTPTTSSSLSILLMAKSKRMQYLSISEEDRRGKAASLLTLAKGASDACDAFSTRMDLYAEAAELGNAEALYLWAMMIGYGAEHPGVQCGFSESSRDWSSDYGQSYHNGASRLGDPDALSQARAVYALAVAAHAGVHAALVPLSSALQSGIASDMLWSIDRDEIYETESIYTSKFDIPWPVDAPNQGQLFREIQLRVLQAADECDNGAGATDVESPKFNPASSAVCWGEEREGDYVGQLAVGLLHVAALHGVSEAEAILYARYQSGQGVQKDLETAAQYGRRAMGRASDQYHKVGGQPILEADRINDKTERQVEKGNLGSTDELIVSQRIRADEGDVNAMIATADLYYFGARGLPRDQAQALQYYNMAARTGHSAGLCNAAAMYLKGEATDKNLSHAVTMYEQAAAQGSAKALNGLGYLYFNGEELAKNETKAFHYFLTAAETETDPSSLFNAGFCLENGIGVNQSNDRAFKFFHTAANKFGNFDSIVHLANMHLDGRGVARSAAGAMTYLQAAVQIGPWAGWIRRGLDNYLSGHHLRAAACYVHSGEFGYEVAQSNAAYVLRRRIVKNMAKSITAKAMQELTAPPNNNNFSGSIPVQPIDKWQHVHTNLILREYTLSALQNNRESSFALGNVYSELAGSDLSTKHRHEVDNEDNMVLADQQKKALWWYSKASASGHGVASLYIGAMHHFGVGVQRNPARALRYYNKALLAQEALEYQLKILTQTLSWLVTHEMEHSTGLVAGMSRFVSVIGKTFWTKS